MIKIQLMLRVQVFIVSPLSTFIGFRKLVILGWNVLSELKGSGKERNLDYRTYMLNCWKCDFKITNPNQELTEPKVIRMFVF